MHKYRLISKKGEGTFSEVLKAQSIKNGKYLAIKCMKNHFDSIEQVNNLREIQALRRLSPNPHIIKLDQPTGRLALVFELMDCNIYELIRGRRHYLPESRVKMYTYQLVKAMDHMHRNGIFHRDIKPENILIMDDLLKLADFGSCRGIYSKQPYTEYISTRWYRAPECLLTDGYYGYKMDMWGVGCVLFEILALYPLFPGENEMDQIKKIHSVLGTPPAEVLAKFKRYSSHIDFNFPTKQGKGIAKLLPHVSADAVDIIVKLLAYDPEDRISARQALRHPWFHEIRTAEKRQAHANAAQRTAKTASSASGRATTRSTVAAATGSSATGGAGSSSVGGSTGETGGGKTQPSGGAVASGTGASSSKGGDASAKAATTVGSDPGLPTIAKGGPAAGSGGKGAASKRHGGHPASSTIALPVSSSTAHASAGSSNSSNKRHHAHHHSTGAASTRRSGHGHHHAGSHASGGGFSHHHPHPRMPPSAAVDASLPPIGKPVYSSTLRVGGAKYHHHHGSHHHSGGAHNKRSGRKRNEYATARSKGGKYHTGRSKMSQTTATARTGGSTNKGGGGVPGKYLSPYSQKFIQKQRQN